MILVPVVFVGCGDNFDRDELMNGPRQPDGAVDTDILTEE